MESSETGAAKDRPINPATQRPVREVPHDRQQRHSDNDAEFEPDENTLDFNIGDLRRWENARITELDEKLISLAAQFEGSQEEFRSILKNEMILALAALFLATGLAGMMKRLTKLEEGGISAVIDAE